MNVPNDIKKIHEAFKQTGYKLYVVGGAVRDYLLGYTPKDFDLTTDANPDEVLAIAAKYGFHTTEVGKAFGVVVVNGHEIATFRKDIGKGRRPDAVEYATIEDDVNRRDLTINALFYDIDTEQIIDLVGGVSDLENRYIRTVGVPEERFSEDHLRKLRALRFQARLDSQLDTNLVFALDNDPSLDGISAERIRDEFIKTIVSAKHPIKYMTTLMSFNMTRYVFPHLHIGSAINVNDYVVFIAYLLMHNNTDTIAKVLNRLKYTKDEVKSISFLVSMIHFTPDDILSYKKAFNQTKLTEDQVLLFGEHINTDFTKFVEFNLSVRGSDAPKDLKSSEIGQWIAKQETKKFMSDKFFRG